MQMFEPIDPKKCQHLRFGSRIQCGKVTKATEPEGRWSMQLEIWCMDCNAQFVFTGLKTLSEGFELGKLPGEPRQSQDGRFMFCQIKPGEVPPHLKITHLIPGGILVTDTIWHESSPDLCSRCHAPINPDDPPPIRIWPAENQQLTFCVKCTAIPRKDPDLPTTWR